MNPNSCLGHERLDPPCSPLRFRTLSRLYSCERFKIQFTGGIAMTALRQRMIEDMQLHSFAERTQDSYLRAVRQLAAYFNKPPDQISEEELRQYFLYLKNVKKASRSTMTLALCGIKFFYERTLQRQWPTWAIVRPQQEKKLPVVLSVEEVRQILSRVRWPTWPTAAAMCARR